MTDIVHVRSLISTRKPGVDKVAVESAEKALGATFPGQYKELVQAVNGAEIDEWGLFPIKDQKNIKKTWDDIVRQNKDPNARWGYMPNDLIAFADDGTGDKLCFKIINNVMEETVYIWNHETNELERAAANLFEFIKNALE